METVRRSNLKNPVAIDELQRSFVVRVYGWMTLGLVVTAAASLFTLTQPDLSRARFESPLLLWGQINSAGCLAEVVPFSAVKWFPFELTKTEAPHGWS